jgi:hypothetical protein
MSARRPVNNSAGVGQYGHLAGNQLCLNDLPPPLTYMPQYQDPRDMSVYSSVPTCTHCGAPFPGVTARGTGTFVGDVLKGGTAVTGAAAAVSGMRAASVFVEKKYPNWGGTTLKGYYQ